ncbi:MAG: hypothetical protein LBI43_00345 [Streptococcaceae bacterium]|jgi:hypothetical protein|nr:hypothetical protein [Streptococcaceae bacterium]
MKKILIIIFSALIGATALGFTYVKVISPAWTRYTYSTNWEFKIPSGSVLTYSKFGEADFHGQVSSLQVYKIEKSSYSNDFALSSSVKNKLTVMLDELKVPQDKRPLFSNVSLIYQKSRNQGLWHFYVLFDKTRQIIYLIQV